MVNAIILAGTHADKTKLIYGKNKAFLEINNQPLILYVLNALKSAESIDKIAIVGPKKDLEKITDVTIVRESTAPKESRRFIENTIRAYDYLSEKGEKTLFITSDLPFIAPKTINDFVSQCSNYDAAFYFALIDIKNIPEEVECFKKSDPFHLADKKSSLFCLADLNYFRTANLVLFESSKMENNRELLEARVEQAFPQRRTTSRISKLCLAWFLAKKYPKEAIKYYYPFKSLKEEDVENALKREMGLSFKFIKTEDLRAMIDIDYKEEYDFYKENYISIKNKYNL